jgi:hypothetical protein
LVPESHARSGSRRYDIFGAVSITAALLMWAALTGGLQWAMWVSSKRAA